MKQFETILVIRATVIASDKLEAAELAHASMMDPPVHLHRCEVIDVTLFEEQDLVDGEEEKEEKEMVASTPLRHIRGDR